MIVRKYLYLLSFLLLFSCEEPPPPLWAGFAEATSFEKKANIPKSIKESSGLIYWQEGLWTINDSGNGALLFKINPDEKDKIAELQLKNTKNIDWESLAADSTFFYIGDFGNNDGIRKNLVIHKVEKNTILQADKKIKVTGSIPFAYQDQEVGSFPQRNHNFDCEAMIAHGDSLYLFSKNHGDKKCTLYRLSQKSEKQIAVPIDTFDTKGKITGATLDAEQSLLVLLGYNQSSQGHRPFVWIFSEFQGNDFFSGKAQRIQLPGYLQTEGITHFQGNQFFITNEESKGQKASVYLLDIGELR